MKRTLGRLLAIVTAAFAGHSVAQSWPQQPTTVLGIELGAPISAQGLPTCVIAELRQRQKAEEDGSATPCIDPPRQGQADRIRRLRSTPKLGEFGYSTDVFLYDGRVESLYLTVAWLNFERLKAVLLERYGPPTKSGTDRVTTGGGTVLASERLEWRGDRVLIVAEERSGRADQSSVLFSSQEITASKSKADAGAAKSAAGKL